MRVGVCPISLARQIRGCALGQLVHCLGWMKLHESELLPKNGLLTPACQICAMGVACRAQNSSKTLTIVAAMETHQTKYPRYSLRADRLPRISCAPLDLISRVRVLPRPPSRSPAKRMRRAHQITVPTAPVPTQAGLPYRLTLRTDRVT